MNRILIIDDNPAIHEDFRKILMPTSHTSPEYDAAIALVLGTDSERPQQASGLDFSVDFASQGQQALQMVQQALTEGKPYCVAFIDIRMPPGWDGVETVTQLWRVDPELQAVLCSAYSDYTWSDIIGRLPKADRLLILKKPFDAIEALQMATLMAEKWHAYHNEVAHREALDQLVAQRTNEAATARAASLESEERFALAFESSPTALAILDADSLGWSSLNKAFRKLTGWSDEPVLVTDFFAANTDLCHRLSDPSAMIEQMAVRIPGPIGQREVLVSRSFFNIGNRAHLMLTMQDISDQIEAENRLRQGQKMEAVGQLAAGLAHDFNNIMTVILGHVSSCLTEKDLTPTVQNALEETHSAGVRAAALTRQLLAFGRKQVMQITASDPSALLEQNIPMLKRLIGEHVAIHTSILADLPRILVDANSFNQVLLNLCINSRDAMPSGGRIFISAAISDIDIEAVRRNRMAQEGNFVCITFHDTGPGMDEITRRHLFEPFFTTKPVGEGTGLGLSTVHGIMAQHGGWIECESSPGNGTAFHLYFRRTENNGTVPQESIVSPSHAPTGSGCTILVVEDEAPIRRMLCAILSRFGFATLAAADAAEALQIWETRVGQAPIDALFTDVVMPGGMSGLHLARILLEKQPNLKVVFSSGYSTDLLHSSDALTTCGHYLPKPYDLDGVSRILNTVFQSISPVAA